MKNEKEVQEPKESKYWANKPVDKIGDELESKIQGYYEYLQLRGTLSLWRRSYNQYFKQLSDGGSIQRAGEQGELSKISVNHYRNLLLNLNVIITQQRPSWEPKASNSDYSSAAQVILASGLLEYYERVKKLGNHTTKAVELCLLFGESFVSVAWDATDGDAYAVDPETQAVEKTGDLAYSAHSPLDVIRDTSVTEAVWYVVRTRKNKFDLAAKYLELEDKILSAGIDTDDAYSTRFDSRKSTQTAEEEDTCTHYTFYHKRTPACPEGRLIEFLDGDTILLDSPLPYRNLPVYRLSAADVTDSVFGYSIGFDILPLQQAMDGVTSTILTNQISFGVQSIAAPRGSGTTVSQLAEGLQLIEYDKQGGPPQGINLTSTPPELFNFLQSLNQMAETLSGVNSVVRGQPEASLKSGAALALVQAMAINFSSGLQHSYISLLQDLGEATINLLQDFASVPRVAMIAGKTNKSLMREFSGKDLSQIQRVLVDVGNPLTKTSAGRVNLAETLLQNGLVKDASSYIEVLNTGRLEPAIESTTAEQMLIRSENERLSEAQDVMAALTDEHLLHIQEHRIVIASPEARENPEVLQATLNHIREHLDILANPANAQMLATLGQQPIQQAPPPGPQAGPEAALALESNAGEPNQPSQANLPNPPANTSEQVQDVMAEQKAVMSARSNGPQIPG